MKEYKTKILGRKKVIKCYNNLYIVVLFYDCCKNANSKTRKLSKYIIKNHFLFYYVTISNCIGQGTHTYI